MYLKRLEMQGFKSFADKISIDFGDGITAIVGPNGCGKSNVSDAIRWVMGEQSAKLLRGSKMEDVIFAGTEQRKPQGFAEVTIVFDNADKIFNIEYEEVAVTRRVFRSGESEYLINRGHCKLKDIHELFMDTGLGRDGYSVIGQGRIDEILSNRAEDRRHIFEEAAGISKYKYRKNETLSKLASTEDNLSRVQDIVGELEGRIGPLEIAAEKAKKYLDLSEKLKQTEVNLAVYNIERLNKVKEDAGKLYKNASDELESARQVADKIREDEKKLYDEIKKKEGETEQVRVRLEQASEQASAVQNDINLLNQSIDNINDGIKRNQAEKDELIKQAESTAKNCEELTALRLKLNLEKENIEKRLGDENANINDFSERIHEANTEILTLQRNLALLEGQIQSIKNKIDGIDALADNFSKRMNALAEISDTAEKNKQRFKNEYDREHTALEKYKKQREEKRKQLADNTEKAQKLQEKFNALRDEYNDKTGLLGKKSARYAALCDMEKSMEGYAAGVKAVMANRNLGDIRGVLSELIKVKKPYITAVETALGNSLQDIVTATEHDAKKAIDYLKSNRLGRATFLPVSSVFGKRLDRENEAENIKGYMCLACDAVECDGEYKDIILNLLGRIVIADNMDNAIQIARKFKYSFKIVTLDGEIFAAGGSVTGGSASARAIQFLSRKQETETLKTETQSLQKECDKLDREIDKIRTEHSQIADNIRCIQSDLADVAEYITKCESACEMNLKLAEKEEQDFIRAKEETVELTRMSENSDGEKKALYEELEKTKQEYKVKEAQTENARENLRNLTKERDSIRDISSHTADDMAAADREIMLCDERLKTAADNIKRFEEAIKQKEKENEEMNLRIAEISSNIKLKIADKEEIMKTAQEFKTEIEKTGNEKSDADKEINELRTRIDAQNEKVFLLQGETLRMETRISKAQGDLDNVINRLWDDYELTYSEALKRKTQLDDVKEAKELVSSLKSKIRALGNVNPDAVDEYKEVKERYEYMQGQLADLNKAKTELIKIINDVTRLMTDIFREKFKVINDEYKKTFKTLFGGGETNLSLENPDNILESGINIDVQPPGKKLQSLSLLSGGERALAAIALLFAIFTVRPAPFCVLDEIEAALDDNNILRFTEYLKGYCDKTQFVIITHRRGTMEAADILYGITMQEKGISKMLSMKL